MMNEGDARWAGRTGGRARAMGGDGGRCGGGAKATSTGAGPMRQMLAAVMVMTMMIVCDGWHDGDDGGWR